MKLIKNMPNWLAHSIFVDADTQIVELQGSEVNLFFALIYLTSQSYDYDKSTPKTTTFIYKKSKIQGSIKETKNLNAAMEKLNGLEIITNILGSYEDGTPNRFKPFVITPIKAKTRVVKFKIEVQEKFIQEFSNPNPKFTLSYENIYAFSNTQAKLLYIILFDHLGKVKVNEKSKTRKIDLENLKILMNRSFEYDVSKLLTDINKAVKLINEHTDIKILKNFNEADDKDENITNRKFEMIRTKPYSLYQKNTQDTSEEDTKSITQQTHEDEEAWQEALQRLESRKKNKNIAPIRDEVKWLEKTYNEIVAEKKKKRAEQDEAEALKKAELKKIEEAKKAELEKNKKLIDEYLEDEKNKLRNKLDDKKGVPLIAFQMYNILDKEDMYFYINQDYQFINQGVEKAKCNDANETYKYLMKYADDITVVIKHTNDVYDLFDKMYFNM